MKSKNLIIIAGSGGVKRWLRQTGPDQCVWTSNKSSATRFDLDKLDKEAVAHIEKYVGPITLQPV